MSTYQLNMFLGERNKATAHLLQSFRWPQTCANIERFFDYWYLTGFTIHNGFGSLDNHQFLQNSISYGIARISIIRIVDRGLLTILSHKDSSWYWLHVRILGFQVFFTWAVLLRLSRPAIIMPPHFSRLQELKTWSPGLALTQQCSKAIMNSESFISLQYQGLVHCNLKHKDVKSSGLHALISYGLEQLFLIFHDQQ